MYKNPFEPKYDDDLLPLMRELLHQRPHLETFVSPRPDPKALSLLLFFRGYTSDGPPPEHLVGAALEALRLADEVVA